MAPPVKSDIFDTHRPHPTKNVPSSQALQEYPQIQMTFCATKICCQAGVRGSPALENLFCMCDNLGLITFLAPQKKNHKLKKQKYNARS